MKLTDQIIDMTHNVFDFTKSRFIIRLLMFDVIYYVIGHIVFLSNQFKHFGRPNVALFLQFRFTLLLLFTQLYDLTAIAIIVYTRCSLLSNTR